MTKQNRQIRASNTLYFYSLVLILTTIFYKVDGRLFTISIIATAIFVFFFKVPLLLHGVFYGSAEAGTFLTVRRKSKFIGLSGFTVITGLLYFTVSDLEWAAFSGACMLCIIDDLMHEDLSSQ